MLLDVYYNCQRGGMGRRQKTKFILDWDVTWGTLWRGWSKEKGKKKERKKGRKKERKNKERKLFVTFQSPSHVSEKCQPPLSCFCNSFAFVDSNPLFRN